MRGVTRTLRSCPEDFKAAQSKGLCPGASATFSRFLDFVTPSWVGGFVVVGGTAKDEDEAGTDNDSAGDEPTPGTRDAGKGGGGMS